MKISQELNNKEIEKTILTVYDKTLPKEAKRICVYTWRDSNGNIGATIEYYIGEEIDE